MNFLGHDLPLPGSESFMKTRQFLKDCPPSSNKEVLRRFIRKYGDKITSETTVMALAVLFEGMEKSKGQIKMKNYFPKRIERCLNL